MSSDHDHGSLKSIFFALAANIGIAIAKTFAAIFTGSGSLLAESVHSYADCGNQLLLLWGMKVSKKEETEDHPLGFGLAIYFWSFIVAIMLFSMGGLFSIYEGLHKIYASETMQNPSLALGVLLLSLVFESLSLYGAYVQIRKEKKDRSIFHWFKTTRKSELIVVAGEDSAAVLGLTFASLAVILTMITGNIIYDALGSIIIGILLVIVAIGLGVEIKSLLIGESAGKELDLELQLFIEAQDEVEKVFTIKTLQLGKDVMLAVKVKMQDDLSAKDMILAINKTEILLHEKFFQIRWIFFEPDIVK